jgi:uncharacterized protein (TIGR02996 family)
MALMLDTATDNAFLRSILANPDDDAPRLIYADWLDEQGDADRAEFIRLQVRLARMPSSDADWASIKSRAEELQHDHHVEWVNQLPQFDGVNWEVFERGFISAVKFEHPDAYFAHPRQVFAAAPIRELRLHLFYWTDAARLADSPHPRAVRVLDLNDGNRIGNQGLEALMASPHLRNLTVLKVARNSLGSAGVRAIAHSSYVRNLLDLRLHRNDLFDDGLRYLAESPAMRQLRRLDLDRTRTGDTGVIALARSKHLTRLQVLYLNNNLITDESIKVLAKTKVLAELQVLYLGGNAIDDHGVKVMADSGQFANLERLDLRQIHLTDMGAMVLYGSQHLGQLRELYVGGNQISDFAADMLRRRFGQGVNVY